MKKIPLKNKKKEIVAYTLVDDEDWEMVNSLGRWSVMKTTDDRNYYVGRTIRKKGTEGRTSLLLHRFILKPPSGFFIDHINGNGLDNRKRNLRLCTPSQNMFNRRISKSKKNGPKGLYWIKERKKWRVMISAYYERFNIGYFSSKREALIAYNEAAIRLHGKFAFLNDVPLTKR